MLRNHNDPCSKEGDGWRVPVMAELAILRNIYGDSKNGDDINNLFKQEEEVLLSCTKEYYSNHGNPMVDIPGSNNPGTDFSRFMGANFKQTYAVNVVDFKGVNTFWGRCVRDKR